MTKERPILFRPDMVKAILENRKTQTRRNIKVSPDINIGFGLCPYGIPGDRLWIREPAKLQSVCHERWRALLYEADEALIEYPWNSPSPFECLRWTPSIHMPRWACRLVVEIVSIRVERLQDISDADAIAEGITQGEDGFYSPGRCAYPSWSFRELYQSIHGPEVWDANPWLWVIQFKRVS
jgi:hypothetical protein